jgi:hypothetical protein
VPGRNTLSDTTVNAKICVIDDSAYYQVRLQWIPRMGEVIDLFSHVDAAFGHPPIHLYKVVQVIHKLHDVAKDSPQAQAAAHFVEIHVKPTQ